VDLAYHRGFSGRSSLLYRLPLATAPGRERINTKNVNSRILENFTGRTEGADMKDREAGSEATSAKNCALD